MYTPNHKATNLYRQIIVQVSTNVRVVEHNITYYILKSGVFYLFDFCRNLNNKLMTQVDSTYLNIKYVKYILLCRKGLCN